MLSRSPYCAAQLGLLAIPYTNRTWPPAGHFAAPVRLTLLPSNPSSAYCPAHLSIALGLRQATLLPSSPYSAAQFRLLPIQSIMCTWHQAYHFAAHLVLCCCRGQLTGHPLYQAHLASVRQRWCPLRLTCAAQCPIGRACD